MLGHMAEEAPVSFNFTGIVIILSLKGIIEVQDEQQGCILARYPELLLPSIQSLHVGQECRGSMVQQTIVHTTTGTRNASFTLMNISARNG